MLLSEYPRPAHDSGIGFHWYPDHLHDREEDLGPLLPHLQSMEVSWLVVPSMPGQPLREAFIRRLIEQGIEPIVRMDTASICPLDQRALGEIAKTYRSWGVHYLVVHSRPNLTGAWDAWRPERLPARFMEFLLPSLETLGSVSDIVPVFSPLFPGGNYQDLLFLEECLEILCQPCHRHLLDKLAIGVLNYPGNKPLTWGAGGIRCCFSKRNLFTSFREKVGGAICCLWLTFLSLRRDIGETV